MKKPLLLFSLTIFIATFSSFGMEYSWSLKNPTSITASNILNPCDKKPPTKLYQMALSFLITPSDPVCPICRKSYKNIGRFIHHMDKEGAPLSTAQIQELLDERRY